MIDHTGAPGGAHPGGTAASDTHGDMGDMARWIWCGAAGVMAILGLFVSAGASEPVGRWGGIVFFIVAVLFVMHQVKLSFDDAEAQAKH